MSTELKEARSENIKELIEENKKEDLEGRKDNEGQLLSENEKREIIGLADWLDINLDGLRLEKQIRRLDRMINHSRSTDGKVRMMDCMGRLSLAKVKIVNEVLQVHKLVKRIEKQTEPKKIDHRYNAQPTNIKDFDASRFEER